MSSLQTSQKDTQQQKQKEIQLQQAKLKSLQSDLEKLNSKITKDETLSADDTKFIGELGWLTALSVSIVAAAAAL
jgi:vacuolar-type H+-ATPase subunit I/STV1